MRSPLRPLTPSRSLAQATALLGHELSTPDALALRAPSLRQPWFWTTGGITPREALLRFYLASDPARLEHTCASYEIPGAWRNLSDRDVSAFGPLQAQVKLHAWFDAVRAHRTPGRLFAQAYLTRFLAELIPPAQLTELLIACLPEQEARHFFVHLHLPSAPDELARTEQVVERYLERLSPACPQDVYTGIRLLEALPLPAQASAFARRVLSSQPGHPARLWRDLGMVQPTAQGLRSVLAGAPCWEMLPEDFVCIFARGGFDTAAPLGGPLGSV